MEDSGTSGSSGDSTVSGGSSGSNGSCLLVTVSGRGVLDLDPMPE